MFETLLDLLPNYNGVTLQNLFLYVLAGVFGALVRVSWLDKPLRGFYRDRNGGLKMGFYAEVVVAIGVAIIIDGHPIRAGIGAIFAPWILNIMRDLLVKQVPKMATAAITAAVSKDTTTKG
jgi:hypothetical protein